MTIYITACANEDGYISILGSRYSLNMAKELMYSEVDAMAKELTANGYSVSVKKDIYSALIKWGNDYFYRYQIEESKVL